MLIDLLLMRRHACKRVTRAADDEARATSPFDRNRNQTPCLKFVQTLVAFRLSDAVPQSPMCTMLYCLTAP